MPAAKALEKHRALLESKKQSILAQVEQCNRRLETLRTARKAQQLLWDSNPESEEELESYPASQERLEEIERLKVQLQATQELCRVDELAVEVKVIERPENVAILAAEQQDGGTWREVIARGRVEYVPFQMKFLIYENAHKAVTYHSLSTVVSKPLQSTELAGSALQACRAPSEVVHCLVQYSKAYKERRDTLLAITNRYGDEQICVETTEFGGYRLSCSDLLEVEWRTAGGPTFLHPFRHKFLMSCDDDAYLVEKYLPKLQRIYKQLKDPKNEAEERMQCLCKIIDICLQMYVKTVSRNTELDAETVAQITSGRNMSSDRNTEEQFDSAERMIPVKQSAQRNNENRQREDKKRASEKITKQEYNGKDEARRKTSKTTLNGMDKILPNGEVKAREKQTKNIVHGRTGHMMEDCGENGIRRKPDKTTSNRKTDERLQDGRNEERQKQTKNIVNGKTDDVIRDCRENGIRRKPDKTTSNRKTDERLQDVRNEERQKQTKKTVNGKTDDVIRDCGENGIRRKPDKTTSNRKIEEGLQDGKIGERQKQAKTIVSGKTDYVIQEYGENGIRRKPDKIISNRKTDEMLQDGKNEQKQAKKSVIGRTDDVIQDKCENEERQKLAKKTVNGKFNDVRIKQISEVNVKEGGKLPVYKLKDNNVQHMSEKDGRNKGPGQSNTKHAKDINEKEKADLQEKRFEPVEIKNKNYKKKTTEIEENLAKCVKNTQDDRERGNQDNKNNSDKENQQTKAKSDKHAAKYKENKNLELAQKNTINKTKNNEGIKDLNFVQKNEMNNKQKVNIINKDSNRNIEKSSGNPGHHKNKKTEKPKNIECLNPFNVDIPLSPITKMGPSNVIKNAHIKNRQPNGMGMQEECNNQKKPTETDPNAKNNKINSKRPKIINSDIPEKRSKSSQNPTGTEEREKVANNEAEKRVNATSMGNLAKNRGTMGDSARSAKVRVKSAQTSGVDTVKNVENRIASSNNAEKTTVANVQSVDIAKVEKKVGSAQNAEKRVSLAYNAKRVSVHNADRRVDSAQIAKERVDLAQNTEKRAGSTQNTEKITNLVHNGKGRANSVYNSEKASPVKRAKLSTVEKAKTSNGVPRINRDKPKNALNVLGKRKISPEVLGTKIPRMMPSFRAHLGKPGTPRQSPRKLVAVNKDKGFFFTKK